MFQIVVKAFFVTYATIGPYDSMEECKAALRSYTIEYTARYDAGERLQFLGKTINPKNVSASCRKT
jgi:hypothetical protein